MSDTSPQEEDRELRKKVEWALGSSISAPANSGKRMEPAKGLAKIERTMQIERVVQLIQDRDKHRDAVVAREARIDELQHIAPDMRTHPEYKGYVETSAGGKWIPLSDRLNYLRQSTQPREEGL